MKTKNAQESLVHGHVVIKDSHGNILVDSDNMVLLVGREFLARKALDGIVNIHTEYDGYKLTDLVLFDDDTETTLKYTYSKTYAYKYKIGGDDKKVQATKEKYDNGVKIKFSISDIKYSDFESQGSSTYQRLNSCGLLLTKDDSADTKLFSRIKFDKVVLTAENSFSLDYYLYF